VLHGLLKHKGKLQLKMDGMGKKTEERRTEKCLKKREILLNTYKTD